MGVYCRRVAVVMDRAGGKMRPTGFAVALQQVSAEAEGPLQVSAEAEGPLQVSAEGPLQISAEGPLQISAEAEGPLQVSVSPVAIFVSPVAIFVSPVAIFVSPVAIFVSVSVAVETVPPAAFRARCHFSLYSTGLPVPGICETEGFGIRYWPSAALSQHGYFLLLRAL